MNNLRNIVCFSAGLLLLPTLDAMNQQEQILHNLPTLKMLCLKTIAKSENLQEIVKLLLGEKEKEKGKKGLEPSLLNSLIRLNLLENDECNEFSDFLNLHYLKELGLTPFDAPTNDQELVTYIPLLITNRRYNDLQNFLDCLSHYNITLAIKAHGVLVTHVRTLVSDIVDNTLDVGNQRFDVIKRWVDDLNVPKSTLKMVIGACIAEKLQRNIFPNDVVAFEIFFNPLPNAIVFNNIKQKTLAYLLPLLPFFTNHGVFITSLGLNSNFITEIPETIAQLTELETLNLNGSSIGEIPVYIGLLSKLHRIRLSNTTFVAVTFFCYFFLRIKSIFNIRPLNNTINQYDSVIVDILIFLSIICLSGTCTQFLTNYLNIYLNENHILPNQVMRQNLNLHIDGEPLPFFYNKAMRKIKNTLQNFNHIKQSVQNEFNYDVGNIDF